MGMQCHFSFEEIEYAGFKVERLADSIIVHNKHNQKPMYYFSCTENLVDKSSWFDVGQLRPLAIEKLHWLITNRIPFTCS
jgi:hypothetical protein